MTPAQSASLHPAPCTPLSPQEASYLAGWLDHHSTLRVSKQRSYPKVYLHVRTKSRSQALWLQQRYGGEIRLFDDSCYVIRYMATVWAHVLADVSAYLSVQRPSWEAAAPAKGLVLPPPQSPLIEYYVAGAVDARARFTAYTTGGRTYPTFQYTYYSEAERLFLLTEPCKYDHLRLTWHRAKAFLERLRPFTRDYDKHWRALHLLVNDPLDESILSHKDAAFYEAEHARLRQKKAHERAVRELTSAWAILDREDAKAERLARAAKREAEAALRRLLRPVDRAFASAFLLDAKSFVSQEQRHDVWWSTLARTQKRCRICKLSKPLDEFQANRVIHDGYEHHCKRCAHERYVAPRLAEFNTRAKAWCKANPEACKAARRREHSKPHVRIRKSLGKRLKDFIGSKRESYATLIGCTPAALTAHLESLFKPGMTWDNYGRHWHVDHVVPVRAFDLLVKEQRLACYHWTNLQPLEGPENARKGDRLPDGRLARHVYPRPAEVVPMEAAAIPEVAA